MVSESQRPASVRQMLIPHPSRSMLNCGKHTCPQRCHQLFDHSKVQCKQIIQEKCPQNHSITWECWKQSASCGKCEAEARKREVQRQRDHKLDMQRQANERVYAQRLAELDEELAHERRLQREHRDQLDRDSVLKQRKKDLADARAATKKVTVMKNQDSEKNVSRKHGAQAGETSKRGESASPSRDSGVHTEQEKDEVPEISGAESDWEFQKKFENADNEHLDALMEMIGLESVKQQIIDVKTKIDTCIRQGVKFEDERFGVALLGNPGTGMT